MFQQIGENTKQTSYKSIWNWQGYVTIDEVLKFVFLHGYLSQVVYHTSLTHCTILQNLSSSSKKYSSLTFQGIEVMPHKFSFS